MSSSSSVVVAGTSVPDHQLLTNEWNWLDFPAEDVVLVAHLHVQLYVLLFGCSTVSRVSNPQKVAFAHSVPDGSLGGQARALAHFAQFSLMSRDKTSGDMDQLRFREF